MCVVALMPASVLNAQSVNNGEFEISLIDKLSDAYPIVKLIKGVIPIDIVGTANPKLVAAINANLAMQMLLEKPVNEMTDSLYKVQLKTAGMTTMMDVIQQSHEKALRNNSKFLEGTEVYTQVVTSVVDLVKQGVMFEQVMKDLKASDLKRQCLGVSAAMKLEAAGLVKNYIEIVTNGKAGSGGVLDGEDNKDDGYNVMSRAQRMDMAKNIISELTKLKYTLASMTNIVASLHRAGCYGQPSEVNVKLDFATRGK